MALPVDHTEGTVYVRKTCTVSDTSIDERGTLISRSRTRREHEMPEKDDRRSVATEVANTVRRARRRFFRRDDFVGSRYSVEKALSRLVERGELLRIRNGLYWKGADTPFGMSPPNPREVVTVYSAPYPSGPAGMSAANLLGLTTQIPRVPEYAAPSTVPDIERISLVRHSPKRANARRSARLNESEVALLEVLGAWERAVELPPDEAFARLVAAMRGGELDANRLAKAAVCEPARVRVRLRSLLDASGRADLSALVPSASAKSVETRALARLKPSAA